MLHGNDHLVWEQSGLDSDRAQALLEAVPINPASTEGQVCLPPSLIPKFMK